MFILSVVFGGCSETEGLKGDASEPEEIPFEDPWEECFMAGTQITLDNNEFLDIEDIQIGDRVLSMNVDSDSLVSRPVVSLIKGSATLFYSLNTRSSKIEGVTAYHPFYLPMRNEWVRAEELKTGDALVIVRNDQKYIEKIEHIELNQFDRPVDVYNFAVAGPEHNYFANSLLVHNKSPAEPESFLDVIISSPNDEDVLIEGAQAFEATLYAYQDPVLGEEEWTVDITWTLSINDETSTLEECAQTLSFDPNQAQEEPLNCSTFLTQGEGKLEIEAIGNVHSANDHISFSVDSSSDSGLD